MEKFEKIVNYEFTRMKAYLLLLFLYVLSYYKVFSLDYLYNDDQGRAYAGYHGWLDWSRWTDTILSNFIHMDTFLYNISPLTQLMACCALALASLLAIQVIFEKREVSLIGIIASLFIGVNPYFIGCFAYKFDCPYMAISVLASIVPLYYWVFAKETSSKNKLIKYAIISIISVLVMFTSYQSSAGMYPELVAVIVIKELFKSDDLKQEIGFIVTSVLSYLFALLFFAKVLAYRKSSADTWTPVTSVKDVLKNYLNYYLEIGKDYKLIWVAFILLLFVSLLCLYLMKYHGNKLRGLIYFVIGNFVLTFLAFGANIFIDCKDLNMLQAKYLYGINAGISFLILLLVWILSTEFKLNGFIQSMVRAVLYCSVCGLAYCFIIFTFIYGNVLESQWKYHEFRVQEVINDLTDLDIMMDGQDKPVRVNGDIGLAPAVQRYPDVKLIKKLLPHTFSEGTWGEFYFRYYFGVPNMLVSDDSEEINDYSKYTLLQESAYHKIYSDDKEVVIVLNDTEQVMWKNRRER